jgi:peroxiredoxin
MRSLRFLAALALSVPLTQTTAFTVSAPAWGRGARCGKSPLCRLRMALEPASPMPMDLSLAVTGDNGPESVSTKELFGGKRCVIFGVCGAFEPTSTKQLESYMGKLLDLKAGGAEVVACVAVNDPYVMKAWAKSEGVGTGNSTIQMLADGNGAFTRALGYMEEGDVLLGERSRPYAIVLDEKGVCEYMIQEKSEDMALKVIGHLDFLKGTGAVPSVVSSRVAALATKVRMDSEKAQAAMAAAYDKARSETVEIGRVKNDFIAKLEMAGRQATVRLKTMGEMGLAAFMASDTNATAEDAQQVLDKLNADRLVSGQKPDSLPTEVYLRSAPMNLAKRNALEANRKQWGIGIDPAKPQRVDVNLKWDSGPSSSPPPKAGSATKAADTKKEDKVEVTKAAETKEEEKTDKAEVKEDKEVAATVVAAAEAEEKEEEAKATPSAASNIVPAPAASAAEKRGDCPVCGKAVMSDEARASIGGQYLHQVHLPMYACPYCAVSTSHLLMYACTHRAVHATMVYAAWMVLM